jgi:hypothetical protein
MDWWRWLGRYVRVRLVGKEKTLSHPKLPVVPGAGHRAREQADAYDSVFSSINLELDNGDSIELPPHPNLQMLDDDRQAAYEELMFEVESYDREPDIYIPEQKLDSGIVLPAETKRGELKRPFRKNGELVKPPHSVRVVQVALGDAAYARLRAGGRCAADVWRCWNEQGMRIAERQVVDRKSNGSSGTLVSLS